MKLRHGQQAGRRVGAATRRRLTVGWTGTALGERLVRRRGIRDADAAGTRARTAAHAELDAIERELLIPQLTPP